jgi:multidrug efflux pump subunit AcrA (membrane-fusion protein)
MRFPKWLAVVAMATAGAWGTGGTVTAVWGAPDNAAPTTTPAATTVTIPASIMAYWTADLNAKTSGFVADVKADLGDVVKKDQVLAEIYVPELEKNLAQSKAMLLARKQMSRAAEAAIAQARQAHVVAQKQLDSYQADLHLQQITLKRQEELSAGNAATPQQLDDARGKAEIAEAGAGIGQAKVVSAEADIQAAEANRDVAAAQVDVAQAQVEEVQAMLSYTKITAPFDGVITRRLVNPGELVQAATSSRTMPLFTVEQTGTVRVFCDVPELKAVGVAVGSSADIKVYGLNGQVISSTVTRLAKSLNPSTRTMRVEIDLKNENELLRPGMYAEVTLTLPPPRRLANVTP